MTEKIRCERQGHVLSIGLNRPAWTAVGVKALVEPQAQFEISARVYLPR